jgi:AcrR family transcriptional regulator
MTTLPLLAHSSKTRRPNAPPQVIRSKGYSATTVDDVRAAAGVAKGSFFHHFKGKEELAIVATQHWTQVIGELFANAPYQQVADPRKRLLPYIDFRAAIVQGELPDFTCLLGTLVQETFQTHQTIRDACNVGINSHVQTLARSLGGRRIVGCKLAAVVYFSPISCQTSRYSPAKSSKTCPSLGPVFARAPSAARAPSTIEASKALYSPCIACIYANPTAHQLI